MIPVYSPYSIPNNNSPQPAANPQSFLESILPGFSGQQNQVSGIINNLLNGTPSPSTTRNAAATFGAANGLGTGSGATARFGYDLYNQMGQKNQQTGISDLLSMLSGVSSPVLQNQGQQNQNSQYYAGLNQQASEFNSEQAMRNQELLDQLGGNKPKLGNTSTYFTPAGTNYKFAQPYY